MQSPAAMFIEIAADQLKAKDGKHDWLYVSQQKELTSFGDTRTKEIKATGLSNDFRIGYELGLQTARVIIHGSVAIGLVGVNPDDVL